MNYFKGLIATSVLLFTAITYANEQALVFSKGERHSSDLQRDQQSKGQQIVELVQLKPGMVVGDVLGGGGYFSELISEKVGVKGKVYLHNNQAYMPWVEKELQARLAEGRLANVIRHDRETDHLDFTDNSLDAIFFVLGYHDLYHTEKDWKIDKEDFLQQLTRALKPKGKLLIVDHSAIAGSDSQYSQELHRIDKDYVIKELSAKGYTLLTTSNLLENLEDTRLISPFDPQMRRKTDRFILLFEKQP